MKRKSFLIYLLVIILFGCENIDHEEVLKFQGYVSCGNCSTPGPIEGINIRLDFPRADGTYESDSEKVITDAMGNYTVTKKVKKGEFKTYYANVDEPYYRWCDNWISPSGVFILPTDISRTNANTNTFNICLVGEVELNVRKDLPESLDSLIIKSTIFTKVGDPIQETSKISNSPTLTWLFFTDKVSSFRLDFVKKKENGTISESTWEALIEPKQTKQFTVSF